MPVKFKPSQTTYKKGQGKVTQHFYIKNTPKEELIDCGCGDGHRMVLGTGR